MRNWTSCWLRLRLRRSRREAPREAEAFRGKEAIAIAAAADARAEAAAIRAETEQIRSRRMAALADQETAERQLEEQGREAKANRRALEDAQEDAEAAANIISGHTLRMEERKKKADAAAEARVKLTMDVGALDNRIRLLTEMEKGLRGLQQGCQAGLSGPEQPPGHPWPGGGSDEDRRQYSLP